MDDHNDLDKKNHLKIGSDEYDLSSGVLVNNGQDGGNEGINLDLTFFSKNILISDDDNGGYSISGSGEIIQFDIFTSNDTFLDKGIYSFQNTSPYSIGTFAYGLYTVGWEKGDLSVDNTFRIVSGKISVDRNGEEYEITIDCKDENGNDVTGYYKGELQYFNSTSNS
ncbi:hypothetical protein [Cyclobacterium plantarum]|uniref:hypothetical protein n=1 Tax=Cyclobacterium plantarum TaxID=2716263 RepID=UPI003F6F8B2C